MPAGTSNLIARASITVTAPPEQVWSALVTPAAIKQYMFGTTVTSDWKEGGPITWKGEWQGRKYEDKGKILQFKPGRALQYTHFSPLAGLPDRPENYHTVTIQLSPEGSATRVSLTQDNNPTEEARAHSEKNWEMMLQGLKKFVE
ncbi:MAG TPA: SRPBCC domain-containing protein [Gemmatimonadales bacterium]